MSIDVEKILKTAQSKLKSNTDFIAKIKRKKPSDLDDRFREHHDDFFNEFDCLNCANCCKTTSPIFYESDIDVLAKHLKMKPSDFIAKYLYIDEDKDYVLKSSPCPFLDTENYCLVYEYRPTACREYPHTKRKRMHQVLDLALKNTTVCPAVAEIMERLKKNYIQ